MCIYIYIYIYIYVYIYIYMLMCVGCRCVYATLAGLQGRELPPPDLSASAPLHYTALYYTNYTILYYTNT